MCVGNRANIRRDLERDESRERDRRGGSRDSSPRADSRERDRQGERKRDGRRDSRDDGECDVGGFKRTSQGRDMVRLQRESAEQEASGSESEHEAPSDLPTLASTYVDGSDLPRPKRPHKYKPKWFTSKDDKERFRALKQQQQPRANGSHSSPASKDRERQGICFSFTCSLCSRVS